MQASNRKGNPVVDLGRKLVEADDQTSEIFISYRRSDTASAAGRLEDSLNSYFGKGRVRRDVSGIPPGKDFVQWIDETVADTSVVLVLIGPNWLSPTESGQSRLHEPDDQLAAEIEAALEQDKLIIPVLLEDARMPRAEELPDRLKDLARRNAVSLADEHWGSDVTRFAKRLSLDISGSVSERRLNRLQRIVVSMLAAPAIGALAWLATRKDFLGPQIAILMALCVVAADGTLLWRVNWFHPSRQRYVWLALIGGPLGALLTFSLYWFLKSLGAQYAPVAAQTAIALLGVILVLMPLLVSLSTFKPSEELL
jgi:TIR domain